MHRRMSALCHNNRLATIRTRSRRLWLTRLCRLCSASRGCSAMSSRHERSSPVRVSGIGQLLNEPRWSASRISALRKRLPHFTSRAMSKPPRQLWASRVLLLLIWLVVFRLLSNWRGLALALSSLAFRAVRLFSRRVLSANRRNRLTSLPNTSSSCSSRATPSRRLSSSRTSRWALARCLGQPPPRPSLPRSSLTNA